MPGLLLVYSDGRPTCMPIPLQKGEVTLGRGAYGDLASDMEISRRHVCVQFASGCFHVQDLGSANGTFVDGVKINTASRSNNSKTLRIGASILTFHSDISNYLSGYIKANNDVVISPTVHKLDEQIAQVARLGSTLHIVGETGSGKERSARVFHDAGPYRAGPFVTVNAAAIPEALAERLLFGTKRGAYSGAFADADGYVQAADGGTLFLDEISELSLPIQAKLLRVLETREVVQVGATKGRKVCFLLCSASNKDLRTEVCAGRFRGDLFFRLHRPEVAIPPLRHRRDEIPWLIAIALKNLSPELQASAVFVEQCMLRNWPGNIRELQGETRAAGQVALIQRVTTVEVSHLSKTAGDAIGQLPSHDGARTAPSAAVGAPGREQIEAVLRRTAGNVSAAARLLGIHRSHLRRLMGRLGLEASRFSPESDG